MRFLSMQLNLVDRTAWEKIIFGADDPVPGAPTTIKIPPALLIDVANSRMAMNALLDGFDVDTLTLNEMEKSHLRVETIS